MRILIVGAGGVGSAMATGIARRSFAEAVVVADVNQGAAEAAVARHGDRFSAATVDASAAAEVAALAAASGADVVVNACDPRFNPGIFDGAFAAGAHYLDMAMHMSERHPEQPYERTGKMLGDDQFAVADEWVERGQLALVGLGVEPGLSDVFARHAADTLFSSINEVGVRDGANLVIDGYEFAPSFSVWTVIEECLNPPIIWERDRGFYTTAPFSEPEVFTFPEGIGAIECVNVEHEEVVLVPRWVECNRVTFKYALGDEFIEYLKMLEKLGLAATAPVNVRGQMVSPRDVVAACLPNPALLGDRMRGLTCAGTWVQGTGTDGQPREVYLYHVADNRQTMAEHGHQAVVWQTSMNAVVGLELLATGAWTGAGVLGPEAFPAAPFLDLLTDHGEPWGMVENPVRRLV
jgi:saccharopine dehydrogenase-like NADP-dependent oxidoreductase